MYWGSDLEVTFFEHFFLQGNDWDNRRTFKARPGMYGFVQLSSTVSGGGGSRRPEKQGKCEGGVGGSAYPKCEIDDRVACLVELLFDEDNILHSMQKV